MLLISQNKFADILSVMMICWFRMTQRHCLSTKYDPIQETINILIDKALTDNWFNSMYDLNLQKDQLTQLLRMASTDQLFQFDGQLYKQCEGVAMGSPLGSLLANVFMCHLEERLSFSEYIQDPFITRCFCHLVINDI